MTKITLDRKYAARKPGDEIEVSDLELDALEALGIARRPAAIEDEPQPEPEVEQEDQPLPAIPLNPPPAVEHPGANGVDEAGGAYHGGGKLIDLPEA